MVETKLAHIVQHYVQSRNTDLYLFSGAIEEEHADQFCSLILSKGSRKPNATLFLTTYGGDPHSAYRMGKMLRRMYARVRLLVTGHCKSAGTLVALGCHEIRFGPFGELGPLDIQLIKPDEDLRFGLGT